MDFFNLSFWENINFVDFVVLLTLANLLMFVSTALIVFLLRRYFIRFDLNHEEGKMSKRDYKLSVFVLISNILVGFVGFSLMNHGFLKLESKSIAGSLLDLLFLMFMIDFGMYFSHFITHKTFLYKLTHSIHHEHESMGTLSLYVMHPLEAFSFGLILIGILCLYSTDLLALLSFVLINWILGVFAHSGIEPSKGQWANYICMTRFHQIHHENPNQNFGFYTPLWDMLFKTRKYELKREV